MPLSGTLSGNELTRNSSRNSRSQSSQIAELLWTDPGLKSRISVRELISTTKTNKQTNKKKRKKNVQAWNEWSSILPKSSQASKKPQRSTDFLFQKATNRLYERSTDFLFKKEKKEEAIFYPHTFVNRIWTIQFTRCVRSISRSNNVPRPEFIFEWAGSPKGGSSSTGRRLLKNELLMAHCIVWSSLLFSSGGRHWKGGGGGCWGREEGSW